MPSPKILYPKPGQKLQLTALSDSLDSAVLSSYIRNKQTLVLLCANAQDGQRLKDELPFFAPDTHILLLPDWETLPYDQFSPHADLISERLATLWKIHQQQAQVIILPINTAMTRLLPAEFLLSRTFLLKVGQTINSEALRADLVHCGYRNVDQVIAPGEFSLRGGLIDLFPMGTDLPFRIDLFDDEIETLRTFDPDTQRTIDKVAEIRMLPAREYPTDEAAISLFRQQYREYINGDPSKSRIYREVSAGLWPAGIEYYLPLFYQKTATVFDYISDDAIWVLHHDVLNAAQNLWSDITSRHAMAGGDIERPVLTPTLIYLTPDEIMGKLKSFGRFELAEYVANSTLPSLAIERKAENPLQKLADFCAEFNGKILIVAESLGRREVMQQFFSEHGLKPKVIDNWQSCIDGKEKLTITVAPIQQGFLFNAEAPLAVITESELYQHVARNKRLRRKIRTSQNDAILRDLAEIKIGDPVVHEEHGIGRYQGLVSLDLGEGDNELMLIEYSEGARLYVPVAQLQQISRYSGQSGENAPLHRLGNPQWEKTKRKAAEQARDTAAELLNLYAQRAAREGHAFTLSQTDYDTFVAGFGFEETLDQASAIRAVIDDMCSGRPMDRLVCGDVGFGKTEVALRAAFIAAMSGKQVAVLAPTTLLVEQHYQNFCDRFANWPIRIAELSRFRSKKETSSAINCLANGTADIVIGTHKLIQPDVIFKNLGLVIIDEEHRFGVRQKEQLKRLRADVDVLAMTATPIPRTLSMAIEGLRDFSVITTAPSRRLAVKTFVTPMRLGIVREAMLRELKRGGQVFFLHNEVDTILNMREKLAESVPEARIAIAHGQLNARELEQTMRDFLQQRYNVLLCSTIIETGIDIPNANTILIHRADKFGLAQLHQLRGRVGRSHHQAYAYLLTPDEITADAKKRLEAIQLSEELGSGFFLAMQDLEIRGAGEVLGDGQSGEMQTVGFSLFSEMLKQAVEDLKNGKEPDLNAPLGVSTEVNLHSPALLPNDYCPDVHERLLLYKRLATSSTADDIQKIHEELIDRFGMLPNAAKVLLDSHRLRIVAKKIGIQKIDASENIIQLQFVKKPSIDPMLIINLIQNQKNYKLVGQDCLRLEIQLTDVAMRIVRVKELIKSLQK